MTSLEREWAARLKAPGSGRRGFLAFLACVPFAISLVRPRRAAFDGMILAPKIEKRKGFSMAAAPGAAALPLIGRLEQLLDLYEQGFISNDQYRRLVDSQG